jgi:hypothetical protein
LSLLKIKLLYFILFYFCFLWWQPDLTVRVTHFPCWLGLAQDFISFYFYVKKFPNSFNSFFFIFLKNWFYFFIFSLQHWIVEDCALLFFYAVILVSRSGSQVWKVNSGWQWFFLTIFSLHLFSFLLLTFDIEFIKYYVFFLICFLWRCPSFTIRVTSLLC